MTIDSKKINASVKQMKELCGRFTDQIDNYTVRKTANAKFEIKSKKPEKTLYQFHFNFDKEMTLLKSLYCLTGGIFIVYVILEIAKMFYKMDCKREWNQKNKGKKQTNFFDE